MKIQKNGSLKIGALGVDQDITSPFLIDHKNEETNNNFHPELGKGDTPIQNQKFDHGFPPPDVFWIRNRRLQ